MTIKIPSWRLITAGIIAVVADIVQWLLIPAFSELGALSPVNDILDFAVGGIMVSLLGFHWVFIPSALGKLVPVVDMMPFWSGAVFFVAAGQSGAPVGQPGQPGQPGQIAIPGIPAAPLPSPQHVLPPATHAPTQTPAAQSDNHLNPFFREIEPK